MAWVERGPVTSTISRFELIEGRRGRSGGGGGGEEEKERGDAAEGGAGEKSEEKLEEDGSTVGEQRL